MAGKTISPGERVLVEICAREVPFSSVLRSQINLALIAWHAGDIGSWWRCQAQFILLRKSQRVRLEKPAAKC
jgi:hypothetical protein